MGNGNCMVQDIENIKFKDSHILPPIILPCDLKKEKKKHREKRARFLYRWLTRACVENGKIL